MTKREVVYKVLMVIAARQGYILSEDIVNACIETELSLPDTDWVSGHIVKHNISVLDRAPEGNKVVRGVQNKMQPDLTTKTSCESNVFEKHPSRKLSKTIPEGIYYCKGKGLSYDARMEVRDGYFILLTGSRINHKQGPSLRKKLSQIRNSPQYVENDVVLKDIYCTSPSSAANIVTGRSTNGWTFWYTDNGISIDLLRK